jgi:hypothetical protein
MPHDIDPSLEIPVEVQQRIFEFEAKLERPYHEILGVAADADRKALRKAYFALSKELHPDRFFRRNVGPFGKRLERIFGKIASVRIARPDARTEIERSLAAAGERACHGERRPKRRAPRPEWPPMAPAKPAEPCLGAPRSPPHAPPPLAHRARSPRANACSRSPWLRSPRVAG